MKRNHCSSANWCWEKKSAAEVKKLSIRDQEGYETFWCHEQGSNDFWPDLKTTFYTFGDSAGECQRSKLGCGDKMLIVEFTSTQKN